MLFFINFKAYQESTGKNAVGLIRSIEKKFGRNPSIIAVVNPLDSMIDTTMTKFAQTAEPLVPGPYTGHLPVTLLKGYGYSGVMLNHSEFKLDTDKIRESIRMAKQSGLITLVCATDPNEIESIIPFEPDYIAYEPPELIGGNISVSTEKPEVVKEAVGLLEGKRTRLIVGAGIKHGMDVRISRELGAGGILVSSGVVKSPDPIKVITEMMREVD
jgi:triosephosphate isomerase